MIECHRLGFSYGERMIFDHLSFKIPELGIFAMMGPSGIGKSSLLKILSGILRPDAGTISGLETKRVGIVFQEDRLLPWYSALKNVMLAMDTPSKEKAAGFLEAFEIENMNALPAVLSGGMRRRIALARAAAFAPDVLLLDEPFAGIDEDLKKRIIPFIKKTAPLIIFITHDVDETNGMNAQKILTLNDGKIEIT